MGGDDSQKLLALERKRLLSGAQQTSGSLQNLTLPQRPSVSERNSSTPPRDILSWCVCKPRWPRRNRGTPTPNTLSA